MNNELKIKLGLTLFAVIILVILTLVFIVKNKSEKTVCFKDNCFKVEIAENDVDRAKGLMDRKELARDRGMLFVFEEEAKRSFWMKNTLIPLDIIWLDEDFKILAIKTAEPCKSDPCSTYDPEVDSKYVLEINAGMSDKVGLNIGDRMQLKSF